VQASSQQNGSKMLSIGMACMACVLLPENSKLGIDFECTSAGVVLSSITADSPLGKAGLIPGCTLQSINGQSVVGVDPPTLVSIIQSARPVGEGVNQAKQLMISYARLETGATASGSTEGSGRGWGRKKTKKADTDHTADTTSPMQAGEEPETSLPAAQVGIEKGSGEASKDESQYDDNTGLLGIPEQPDAQLVDEKNQLVKVVLVKEKDGKIKLGVRFECHDDGVHIKEVEEGSPCGQAGVTVGHSIVAVHFSNRSSRSDLRNADSLSLAAALAAIPEDQTDEAGSGPNCIKTVELELAHAESDGMSADGFFFGNTDELEITVPKDTCAGDHFHHRIGGMDLDVCVPPEAGHAEGEAPARAKSIYIVPSTCVAYATEHMQEYVIDCVDSRTRGNVALFPNDLILENPVFKQDGFGIEQPGTDGYWKCNECAQRIPIFADQGQVLEDTFSRSDSERNLYLELSMELQHRACSSLADLEPDPKKKKAFQQKLKSINKISKQVKRFVKFLLFFEQFDDITSMDKEEALKNKEKSIMPECGGSDKKGKKSFKRILKTREQMKEVQIQEEKVTQMVKEDVSFSGLSNKYEKTKLMKTSTVRRKSVSRHDIDTALVHEKE